MSAQAQAHAIEVRGEGHLHPGVGLVDALAQPGGGVHLAGEGQQAHPHPPRIETVGSVSIPEPPAKGWA